MPPADPATRKLFTAAKKGVTAAVRDALAHGADMTARDRNGWMALHEACRYGWLDACTALLAAGADPGARVGTDQQTVVDGAPPTHAASVRALVTRIRKVAR